MKKYFENFEWALPSAFSSPLANCRFEQGDILYDNLAAYSMTWGEAKKLLRYSIQITFPPRAPQGSSSSDSASAFESNWHSRVELEITNYSDGTRKNVTTTQGQLYKALWKGPIDSLFDTSPPSIPLTAPDVHKRLKLFMPTNPTELTILFAHDETSLIHIGKQARLKQTLPQSVIYSDISNAEICQKLTVEILPTVKIIQIQTDIPLTEITELLKSALYTPSKNRIATEDRFSTKSHCLITQ